MRGIKPVFVTGRGIADQNWTTGISKIAKESGLTVQEGAYWDAAQWSDDFPAWYAEDTKSLLSPFRAIYITRAKKTTEEVAAICANGGELSMADEARLLAYPDCCVRAHYLRAEGWNRATLSILSRHCEGDEEKMKKMLASEQLPLPETDEEKMIYQMAYSVYPAKMGSWNMCAKCRDSDESPSAVQIAKNRKVAEFTDQQLAEMLSS
jgi:hypothetical protein